MKMIQKIKTVWMRYKKYEVYLAISAFSVCFFIIFYGTYCLNPCNVDWLLSGGLDISQHYAGWMFFRKEPWTFPIGNFTGLSYPNTMSVIYMDCIPLLSVLFKIFQPILPEKFQYFGWYSLLVFIFQGLLGVKIIRKYIKNGPAAFMVGVLTVMTPAFLWRTFLHIALNSHYIVLLAFLSIFYYDEYFAGHKRRKIYFWVILGLLCCMIHLYFVPMCFLILCGFLYLDIRLQKNCGVEQAFILIGFWLGVLVPMYIMGGFIPKMKVSSLDFGWIKTFNLNGFINPQGWSRVLPNLSLHTYGQSEGFAYLGIGIILCVSISLFLFIFRYIKMPGKWDMMKKYMKNPMLQTCGAIFSLSIIMSTSPVVTLGGRVVALPFPDDLEEIWIIFRCSGRLIWPAVYLLFFLACILLSRCSKRKMIFPILAVGVILQFMDISSEVWDRGKISREPLPFVSELKDSRWDVIGMHPLIHNIVYVNVSGLCSCASMAEFADKYDMTLGKFYYARDYETVVDETTVQALKEKRSENIFLFDQDRMIDAWNEPELYYYILDGKLLGYVQPIEGLEAARIDVRTHEYVSLCEVTSESVGEEMINGFLFLHSGGMSISPSYYLPEGRYQFVLEGENLADANITLSIGELLEQDMQSALGIICCEEAKDFQIKVENASYHDMVLYQIKIQPIECGVRAKN